VAAAGLVRRHELPASTGAGAQGRPPRSMSETIRDRRWAQKQVEAARPGRQTSEQHASGGHGYCALRTQIDRPDVAAGSAGSGDQTHSSLVVLIRSVAGAAALASKPRALALCRQSSQESHRAGLPICRSTLVALWSPNQFGAGRFPPNQRPPAERMGWSRVGMRPSASPTEAEARVMGGSGVAGGLVRGSQKLFSSRANSLAWRESAPLRARGNLPEWIRPARSASKLHESQLPVLRADQPARSGHRGRRNSQKCGLGRSPSTQRRQSRGAPLSLRRSAGGQS